MQRSSAKPFFVLFCACAAPCMAAVTLTPADLQSPSDTSWNANNLVGIAGTTRELRIMDEQTQWAEFNWLLLDTQNDGFPSGIGTSTNDTTISIPANGIGNAVTMLIPAGATFALLNDSDDGSGSKGTGPNGVLNSLDSYLSSIMAKNQTTLVGSQFLKYYLADPTQDYEFTVHDQTSKLGHGCVAFIFIDDGHIGANFDYNDMIACIRGCSTNTECQDGVFCNGQEICDNGRCVAGPPVSCNDGIPCTVDVCLEQTHTCMNKPHNALCSDGIFCNGVEQCDPARGCVPDPFPPSCDDGVPCTTDTCNETTHACDHTPNNTRCDDDIFCNGVEICHPLHNCEPGIPLN
ncbi:MAG: hypothetical protein HY287_09400 [Planctomycetes bacterium]|nr:hypothetical protein [Planctomycetota bacterium]MBI3834527.1 hypothetical protein [Planctomycetota bacterium]